MIWGQLTLQQIVQAVLLPQGVDLALHLVVLLFQIVALCQLRAVLLQALHVFHQLSDVCLPHHIAALHRCAAQQGVLVQLHRAVHGGLQLPAVYHAAVLGTAVHVALPVHQLHRQRGDAQQLLIAGVGLDQAAAQAPFQRSRRHQAVNDGHIPQKLPDQGKWKP